MQCIWGLGLQYFWIGYDLNGWSVKVLLCIKKKPLIYEVWWYWMLAWQCRLHRCEYFHTPTIMDLFFFPFFSFVCKLMGGGKLQILYSSLETSPWEQHLSEPRKQHPNTVLQSVLSLQYKSRKAGTTTCVLSSILLAVKLVNMAFKMRLPGFIWGHCSFVYISRHTQHSTEATPLPRLTRF